MAKNLIMAFRVTEWQKEYIEKYLSYKKISLGNYVTNQIRTEAIAEAHGIVSEIKKLKSEISDIRAKIERLKATADKTESDEVRADSLGLIPHYEQMMEPKEKRFNELREEHSFFFSVSSFMLLSPELEEMSEQNREWREKEEAWREKNADRAELGSDDTTGENNQ